MAEEETFENATSGASETYPQQCSALRKNGFVCIKGHPCKIVEMSTSKTGKHGHAKVHLVAIDIFTTKKYEDICPSTHNMNVPNVKRTEYTLLDIGDDDFLSLMDETGDTREDIKMPPADSDLHKTIRNSFDDGGDSSIMITVLKAMGEEAVVGCKTGQDGGK